VASGDECKVVHPGRLDLRPRAVARILALRSSRDLLRDRVSSDRPPIALGERHAVRRRCVLGVYFSIIGLDRAPHVCALTWLHRWVMLLGRPPGAVD
jgi:hypothetical protein